MRKLPDSEFMQLSDIEINSQVEAMANLFKPSEFRSRFDALLEGGRNQGAFKPFWDQFGDKFVLRPKELTIVFGSRGSYKSTLVNYLAAQYLMERAGMVGLISYEMEPEDLLYLFVEQMANSVSFTAEFSKLAHDHIENQLVMVDEMVDSPHSAIAKCHAMLDMGCKLVILDCLQRVNMPANNIDLEREFVVELSNLARKYSAHIIVVHHSRKGSHADGDNPFPVVDDLKGSGGLADNSHNIAAVWSNKPKKELQTRIDNGYTPTPEELDLLEKPDVVVDVKKQRKGIFEGKIGLWRTPARAFHRKGAKVNVLERK